MGIPSKDEIKAASDFNKREREKLIKNLLKISP